MEIVHGLMGMQKNEFADKMQKGIPAAEILNDVFIRYEKEMLDQGSSLSIAIYEFFSNPNRSKGDHSIARQYLYSKNMWLELIRYGMKRKEFKEVNPEAIFNLIVFSYQGVRMYGAMMEIDTNIPKGMIAQIKRLLLQESEDISNENSFL